jgi:hypothetical protein
MFLASVLVRGIDPPENIQNRGRSGGRMALGSALAWNMVNAF